MKKKTTEQFILDAQKIHGDKYDYSLVEYKGVKTSIKIKCDKGHVFEQTPNDHLNGHGCKVCSGWGQLKFNDGEFILRAKEIHGDFYDYSKFEYKGHDINSTIICPKHGEFKQSPKTHIVNKGGCSKCGYESSSKKRTSKIEDFIIRANKIHNSYYIYDNTIFKNYTTPIIISCPKHGEFTIMPKDHIHGKQGCKYCNVSKGENQIRRFLTENHIIFFHEYSFDGLVNPQTGYKLYYDFYVPEFNMVIEFDGQQHFKSFPRFGGDEAFNYIKFKDEFKNKYCVENNIKLLRINHTQINQIENILKEKLCLTI